MGDFDLEDKKRPGRPSELDDHELEELISTDPSLSTRELALRLSVSNSTVYDRLKALGKVQKLGKWVPHKLSEMNRLTRLNTCAFLLSKQKRKSFLYKIVTGDEKWIYFDNSSNKKQWLDPSQKASHVPRPEIHQKKVMLCVWYLFRSMQHFLRDKRFTDVTMVRNEVSQYFDSKPVTFYEKGIKSLPERWQKVISNNGNYFDD